MKILLLGNHQQDSVQGPSMAIFADLLYTALRDRGHEVVLARPRPLVWRFVRGRKALGKLAKYIDQFLFFPLELRRLARRADVVHICDHSNAHFLGHLKHKPCLITCHDVIGIKRALGFYKVEKARWTGRILQAWIARSLQRADLVACVSQTVKQEFQELLGVPDTKVSVVYNGLNFPYVPMDEVSIGKELSSVELPTDRHFILHVGTNSWRKNRRAVVDIFAELRAMNHPFAGSLVFVGAPLNQELKCYLEKRGLSADVISLGNVSTELLCALYSKSALFLFPSLYEGFGWPIIEAQACGCLVATSSREPMREVSGDGALHIDPEDPVRSAEIIARASQAQCQTIRQRGKENARRFSPEAMVETYESLYKLILASPERSTIAASLAKRIFLL